MTVIISIHPCRAAAVLSARDCSGLDERAMLLAQFLGDASLHDRRGYFCRVLALPEVIYPPDTIMLSFGVPKPQTGES